MERVQNWQREKVEQTADVRERQLDRAWAEHRRTMRLEASTNGTEQGVTANETRGVQKQGNEHGKSEQRR